MGNINYFPNKLACYSFATKILPELRKKYSKIEFNIIGKINIFDRLLLNRFSNVKIHGPVIKIDSIIKNSICGICNLKVATGLQMKIFTYMSYGLPVITSKESFPKNLFKNKKDILIYSSQDQFVKCIFELIKNKKLANLISTNSIKIIKKKLTSKKIYNKYL